MWPQLTTGIEKVDPRIAQLPARPLPQLQPKRNRDWSGPNSPNPADGGGKKTALLRPPSWAVTCRRQRSPLSGLTFRAQRWNADRGERSEVRSPAATWARGRCSWARPRYRTTSAAPACSSRPWKPLWPTSPAAPTEGSCSPCAPWCQSPSTAGTWGGPGRGWRRWKGGKGGVRRETAGEKKGGLP